MRMILLCLLISLCPVVLVAQGWFAQSSGVGENLRRVFFLDESVGWIVGESGRILHTTDGGALWVRQESGVRHTLNDLWFIDMNNGWIVGNEGTILNTTNGGSTWQRWPNRWQEGDADFYGIYFVDASTGWIVGGHTPTTGGGIVLQFTDGRHWSYLGGLPGFFVKEHLVDTHFTDTQTGWSIGHWLGRNSIYRTTNGGQWWTRTESHRLHQMNDVFMASQNAGWVVGNDGNILYSNDGIVWTRQNAQTTNDLKEVFFLDEVRGWIVGEDGTVLVTDDAGVSWSPQQTTASKITFNSIVFVNDSTGWIVGTDGTILATTSGGEASSVPARLSNITGDNPSSFRLFQNHPNPFNPTTMIDYILPAASYVRLEVFNVSGEHVEVLKEGYEDAGYHSLVFKADALPSGIYFYRLQTGGFVETRKLLLLK